MFDGLFRGSLECLATLLGHHLRRALQDALKPLAAALLRWNKARQPLELLVSTFTCPVFLAVMSSKKRGFDG
jgi:hypothetical protein